MTDTPPILSPPVPLQVSTVENALYIVATPIGNLGDISYRAVAILQAVDVIFCEDTRTSAKLLRAFHIDTKTLSYHDHNGDVIRPKILQMLQDGKAIALISDAGTPLVNDPGYKLVDAAIQAAHKVIPVPGACAPLTALMAAGLPSDVFTYLGFLPHKSTAKRKVLNALTPQQGTVIVLDTPHRLGDTLRILQQDVPACQVVVARELTKKFEHFVRIQAQHISEHIIQQIPTKGECVLLLRLPPQPTDIDVDALLVQHLHRHSLKDAVNRVADISGVAKNTVYQRALQIKNQDTQNRCGTGHIPKDY